MATDKGTSDTGKSMKDGISGPSAPRLGNSLTSMFVLSLRQMLYGKKVIALVFLAVLPLLAALLWVFKGDHSTAMDTFGGFGIIIDMQFVLPMVCILLAGPIVQEEFEKKTVVYLMVRPVDRRWIVASKFASFVTITYPLIIVPLIATYFIIGSYDKPFDPDHLDYLWCFMAGIFLGVVAYGAVFTMVGTLTDHPLIIGLLFSFIVETFVANISGALQKISIMYYLRTVAFSFIGDGSMAGTTYDMAVWKALLVILLVVSFSLGLATYKIRSKEVK